MDRIPDNLAGGITRIRCYDDGKALGLDVFLEVLDLGYLYCAVKSQLTFVCSMLSWYLC